LEVEGFGFNQGQISNILIHFKVSEKLDVTNFDAYLSTFNVNNSLLVKEKVDGNLNERMPLKSGENVNMFNIPKKYETELCEEGLGGTYFVMDEKGEKVFVFKPEDEEPGCVNNPKKNFKEVKNGVKPGEGAIREWIAFMLDRDHFAKVPKTKYVELEKFGNNSETKKGSLQEFIKNVGNTMDFGSSLFSVENVQRIAQFDIRTFNLDRNGENLLVCENNGEYELIPIDHSYILPSVIGNAWFEWMNWKQVKQPITNEVRKYIEEIDIESDALKLQKLGIGEESITTMKLSTLVLKRGSQVGWTLHQIASFVCSPISRTDKRSEFEKIVHQAKQKKMDPSGTHSLSSYLYL